MLSSEDLESLIAAKKREIQKEKALLGLEPLVESTVQDLPEDRENVCSTKQVTFKESASVQENNGADEEQKTGLYELEERIPAGLERYIRRYIGLPVMLKAGEFSPNNPLVRGERALGGDALLGLGEYERRRNTLRKIRQAQYREYLDRQAKKKQEAKEEAERERREQEQKEREREERERQLLLERESYSQSPERRRASVSWPVQQYGTSQVNKVDSAIQVDGLSRPLSVAVQTDDAEFYRLSPSPTKLTQAERELSPRTVAEPRGADWNKWDCERRRSYGDFDERTSSIKKSNREKLHSDLRHSYMPSIYDADAIQLRNLQAEKDAAERRQFYQQELKNQIMEQQRIREERKTREKLLEQAEMRRLEEQLRMLRVAQEREIDKQHDITASIKSNAREYESKRTELQRDIDIETQKLRASSHPTRNIPKRTTNTSKSDSHKQLYDQNEKSFQPIDKKPYSFNIPDNSIFSSNYDVDSYLRKNLNFKNKHGVEIFNNNDTKNYRNTQESHDTIEYKNKDTKEYKKVDIKETRIPNDTERKIVVEKALIHEPKERIPRPNTLVYDANLSVPVLRHSPKKQPETNDTPSPLSDAMKKVDDKWKVPAVQKNILKSMPNEEGKNISILTQLGSIRRQLQLEQLELDKMLSKND